MKIKALAFLIAPALLAACGDSSSHDSDVSSNKKKFIVVCDGAVFNNADPFGKRVTLLAKGTKTYKAGEFDANKEKAELTKVATALRQQCNGGYTIVNTSICDQIDVVNTDLAFHSLSHSVNGFTYKGSYSCNLAEKK
ncbi:hypothetical protein [Oligoflexus tunisiensis]|uniref:hypothetical protein n=1 Tax=Oligoflexus tunisiensis TaxID=708132 RepID=UPI00114D2FF6|nr:hypothetical protein [Oligoflexus tunisiensis]